MKFDKKLVLYALSAVSTMSPLIYVGKTQSTGGRKVRVAFIRLTTEFQRCHFNVSIVSYLVLKV